MAERTPVVRLAIDDASIVSEARRIAAGLADLGGFDKTLRGRASIVASELASNIVKHVREGGELIMQLRRNPTALEVFAIDRGPGMEDVNQCLRDGFTTTGSSGTGLGAVSRLSTLFDIYSRPESGTVVFSRIDAKDTYEGMERRYWDIGALCLPHPHEQACGDGWAAAEEKDRLLLMVSDGLGHGLAAEQATLKAIEVFHQRKGLGPDNLLAHLHEELRSTRGAAIAMAEVLLDEGKLLYSGIGNIAGALYGKGRSRNLISLNGTVGHAIRKVQGYSHDWSQESLLGMHSDGIRADWNLDKYPGLTLRHPSAIAAVIFRDNQRGRDDATVVVAKQRK